MTVKKKQKSLFKKFNVNVVSHSIVNKKQQEHGKKRSTPCCLCPVAIKSHWLMLWDTKMRWRRRRRIRCVMINFNPETS
jgi:hypothetical protein